MNNNDDMLVIRSITLNVLIFTGVEKLKVLAAERCKNYCPLKLVGFDAAGTANRTPKF